MADKMREWLMSDRGRRQSHRRSGNVEPTFGLIKQQRGCRGFLFRGLKQVTAEWSFVGAVTNLWKLHHCAPQAAVA